MLAGHRRIYEDQNKQASTAASVAAIAKFEAEFKKKIKSHSYDVIGGYENYCLDLEDVMKKYEAADGLGVEVIIYRYDYYFNFPNNPKNYQTFAFNIVQLQLTLKSSSHYAKTIII